MLKTFGFGLDRNTQMANCIVNGRHFEGGIRTIIINLSNIMLETNNYYVGKAVFNKSFNVSQGPASVLEVLMASNSLFDFNILK